MFLKKLIDGILREKIISKNNKKKSLRIPEVEN